MSINKILQNELITRRTFLIGLGKAGLLSLLFSRLVYIQLFKRKEYTKLSEQNRLSLIITPPIRGNIYDITGKELAINKACFRLLLDKNLSPHYLQEIDHLGKILLLSEETLEDIIKKVKRGNRKTPILILDHLDWKTISIIEEYKTILISIFVDKSGVRFYPFGADFCHIIGYTGKAEQKNSSNYLINAGDFNIGKTGLEKYYEPAIKGECGYKQMETNAYGKYIRLMAKTDSQIGQNLHLNIDADLQSQVVSYLNPQGASALVMDIHTGSMLVMAATPNFEPNNFNKLTNEYWQSLINDPYKPLINKITHTAYPPGSIFKLITILAALEAGVNPDRMIHCSGGSMLSGKHFRCHARQGHGNLNMMQAIKYSCNSYMYQIGRSIGADKIIAVAKKFGFGEISGIDLPGEISGLLPSKDWKKQKFNSSWTVADTMNLAIGQGFLLTTPIQIVRFIGAIATKGKILTPQIIQNSQKPSELIDIDPKHFDIMHQALNEAVNSKGGTAYYSRIVDPRRQLAGKTGTAQVQSKANPGQDLNSNAIEWQKRNHAVFIGFAPYEAPKYAISVFVDHGGGGGRAAAPIASKIMNLVLERYENQ